MLVTSKTVEEGMEKLDRVLSVLGDARVTLKLQKCEFFQTKVEFIDYEVSAEGLRPQVKKTKAVQEFETPKNALEVRQFCGLASYFLN